MNLRSMLLLFAAGLGLLCLSTYAQDGAKADGYRGIWYYNQKTNDEYVYKYSGGLGTYCANHIPLAIYAPAAEKTFFVYGGRPGGANTLLEMIGSYDHRTGRVSRPTILMDKKTDDAHDNPVLAIDKDGHLWVFASSHGTSRPSFIFRSLRPHDISAFETVLETNFSYPQPWYLHDQGFLFLHTYYKSGRGLNWSVSKDGREWTERRLLAHIQEGHYQVSWPGANGVGAAFNYHPTAFQGDPEKKGLNWRTNLYYLFTPDMGNSWRSAQGELLEIPVTQPANPALVHDYEAEGLLVYPHDLKFDASGNPVILFLTGSTWQPGPQGSPRTWRIAHWTGGAWAVHPITESDHNYDTGALCIEPGGAWTVIGPTEDGPQTFATGGEIALWKSTNQGKHWTRERILTGNSSFNHSYVRSVLNAKAEFKVFWADGHARQPSPSRLYFYNEPRNVVYRLPETIRDETAFPEALEMPCPSGVKP